jgi:hypothetical protein
LTGALSLKKFLHNCFLVLVDWAAMTVPAVSGIVGVLLLALFYVGYRRCRRRRGEAQVAELDAAPRMEMQQLEELPQPILRVPKLKTGAFQVFMRCRAKYRVFVPFLYLHHSVLQNVIATDILQPDACLIRTFKIAYYAVKLQLTTCIYGSVDILLFKGRNSS